MADRTVLIRLKMSNNDFIRGVGEAGFAVDGLRKNIDTTNDRVALMVQGFLGLGPALVPLGAAAGPVLSGIATQATVAGAALGVMVLGMMGLGDALKEVDDFQLDPTVENLEKMRIELDKLGPEGANFVAFLDSIEPKIRSLQLASREGMFPGFQEGISEVLDQLPLFRTIVRNIAQGLGDLAAEGGAGLVDGRFGDFFLFLQTDATPILKDMGRTVGNLADGLAQMLVAFLPLSKDFSGGFLQMSRDFAAWAHGLEDSTSFQDFVQYVQESGPKAIDFLGSLVAALVQLTEATAPVGEVVLTIMTKLLDVIAVLADTPLASVFIGALAAMSLYGRAMGLIEASTGRTGQATLKLAQSYGFFTAQQKAALPTLLQTRAAMETFSTDAQLMSKRTEEARGAVSRFGSTLIKPAALLGGMAFVASGASESLGLTNTALLGMAGSIAGPWGVALGAGAGFLLDFRAASGKAGDGLADLDTALQRNEFNLRAQSEALKKARDDYEAIQAKYVGSASTLNALKNPLEFLTQGPKAGSVNPFGDFDIKFGNQDELDAVNKRLNEHTQLLNNTMLLGRALDVEWKNGFIPTTDELTQVLVKAKPALDGMGISLDDIRNMSPLEFEQLARDIRDFVDASDSAAAKSQAVSDELVELAGGITDTASAADSLKAALDNLFGSQLSMSEATDQWFAGLQDLKKAIKDSKGEIFGQSEALRATREAIRGNIEDLSDRAVAEVEVTGSGKKFVQRLLEGRDAIIAQGVAAGAKRPEIEKYVNSLGLTPDSIATQILTPGLLTAQEQVRALADLYNLTPRQVSTIIREVGAATTYAAVEKLQKKYGLTPKELKTILRAQDEATAEIERLNRLRLNDKTLRIRTITSKTPVAKGGMFMGDVQYYAQGGMDIANRHEPHIARTQRVFAEPETQGEAYIPLAPDARRPRAKRILEQTAGMFGGDIRWFAGGGFDGIDISPRTRPNDRSVDESTRSMRGFRDEVDKSKEAIKQERKDREEARRQKRDELRSTVTSNLMPDSLFSTDGADVWAGSTSVNDKLRAQIKEARQLKKDARDLRKKGLRGDALAAVLSEGGAVASDYADQSKAELRTYQQLYSRAARVAGSAGDMAAVAAYGGKVDETNRLVGQLSQDVKEVKGAIYDAGDKNAQDITKGVNGAASAGTRGRRR